MHFDALRILSKNSIGNYQNHEYIVEFRNKNCVRKQYGRDSQMLPNDKSKTYSDKLY